MKYILTPLFFLLSQSVFSQTAINSKTYGSLVFKELDHGLAKVEHGKDDVLINTPTGSHNWLKDFAIVNSSDSIQLQPKANFGVVYEVEAKDTFNIEITIEWIFPQEILNDKGEKFKRVKYTTTRPTNIPSASSYSLDEPYEQVKGRWTENIYIEKKKVLSRSFIVY